MHSLERVDDESRLRCNVSLTCRLVSLVETLPSFLRGEGLSLCGTLGEAFGHPAHLVIEQRRLCYGKEGLKHCNGGVVQKV